MTGAERALKAACPVCRATDSEIIFEAPRVPVHAILNLRTREEADAFPMGAIRLIACPECGFIHNALFDPATQRFGPDYEETQGFSPRFRDFQSAMASRLVARHGLRGKRVIEIGCGKGDFLRLLCRLGDNSGIGFDPAWVPRGEEIPGAEFAAAYYGPENAGLKTDFMCCNMTLEHIADPLGFLRMIRANLDGAGRPPLFVMVPDAARLLHEAAFWDVYYEHCNYFTRGSLARLFSRAGFDVEWLGVEFEGQYASIEARPAEREAKIACGGMESADEIMRAARDFRDRVARSVRGWTKALGRRRAQGQRIVIWGGGSKAVAFLGAVAPDASADAVVDINPHRQGAWMPGLGLRVESPAIIAQLEPAVVVVMNPAYTGEIQKLISKMGLQPEILALGEFEPA